ncbi:unnamed protein product [Soboliphyme baturini]|uniref:EF-hand domain-containing protein n=1 Tax=Soboliphyme baturini TaxID=241478 RepID=A0A183I8T5_9BILA|nr:unnamed protein product [Soboliphyme baturini]
MPDHRERSDALLYARNVQFLMARHLGLPATEYSVEDARYLTSTYSTKRSDFWDLVTKLEIPVHQSANMSEFQDSWETLRTSSWSRCNYTVNFDDFARFLNHAPDDDVHRLFNMFDWHCSGQIDLREFLIMLYSNRLTLEYFIACCKMFTENGKPLQESDFVKIVRLPYQFSVGKCKRIYSFGLSKSVSHSNNSSGNYEKQILRSSLAKLKMIRDSPAAVISRFRNGLIEELIVDTATDTKLLKELFRINIKRGARQEDIILPRIFVTALKFLSNCLNWGGSMN